MWRVFLFSVYSVSEVFSLYLFGLPDRCHAPLNFTLDMPMAQIDVYETSLLLSGSFSIPITSFLDVEGIFLDRATNNFAKYDAVIALMTNASALRIRSLVVRLDSELVVSQLTSRYSVRHPVLY